MFDCISELGEHASRREPRCTDSKVSIAQWLSATNTIAGLMLMSQPRGTEVGEELNYTTEIGLVNM
jgi:hypothetical protein